ncbi:MAG: RluA family pseudouridine synthase, partial [Planococcus sp. (in: Bacteria)]|nr:RluA family pseudouridine synthase [Planococcus sp. (in: firmicutes)]
NRHIHHMISMQQQEKKMKRRYEALVHGLVEKDEFTITAPIGRKNTSIIEREVREDGQFAETEVRVIKRLPDYSHISLQLNTGRTHQIRVHLAHIGHPLVGDDLYGGKRERLDRQALHCTELELIHPVSGEKLFFSSSLNEDMQALV